MRRNLGLVILILAATCGLYGSLAFATDPSVLMGVPQPSAAPTTCGLRVAGFYGDPNGCLYACANGARAIVAGAGCVFGTAVATQTPFPTATVTPSIP